MKRSKFTDEQIAFALKQAELGISVERSAARWASATRPSTSGTRSTAGLVRRSCLRLRQLEEENRKLKQIVADLSLDKAMLQHVISKKL